MSDTPDKKPTVHQEDERAKLRIEHEQLRRQIEAGDQDAALAVDSALEELQMKYEIVEMKRTGRIPPPQTPEFYFRWAAEEDYYDA